MVCQSADHRRIVSAVFWRGKFQGDPFGEPFCHQTAKFGIAGDSAGDDYRPYREIFYGKQSFFHQHIDHRILISGGGISEPLRISKGGVTGVADMVE